MSEVSGGNTFQGGSTNDRFHGNESDELIYGLGGNDRLYGNDGNDTLYGESGNDRLYGNGGNDTLYGESGNDRLYGDSGNDTLLGGDGNDRLYGQSGDNTLNGGAGSDRLYGGDGSDTYVISANSGLSRIYDFLDGEDKIYLESGMSGITWSNNGENTDMFKDGDLIAIIEGISEDQLIQSGNYLI